MHDFEVLVECVWRSWRQDKTKQPGPLFRPPCGWQRIWRISHQGEVLWDRRARHCQLPASPVLGPADASGGAGRSGLGLGCLPAAVLARVILGCDLSALLSLSAALPAVGRQGNASTREVGEAMPSGHHPAGGPRPERWLSFARASLRWADLLAGLRGLPKAVSGAGASARARRPAEDGESFSASGFKATVTSEACCVAMCADTKLLATGHQHGIRLWGLPGVKKMGLLQTRGAAVSLDIGQRGELLAAVLLSGDSFCVCAWDLTSLCPRAAALWQLPVPSTPLHFLAEGLMVSSPQGLQLLDLQGAAREILPLPGAPSASCRLGLESRVLAAVGARIFAAGAAASSSDPVQGRVCAFASTSASVTSLAASSSEVAAATCDGHIFLWRSDGVPLAELRALSELDLENLSWSTARAENLNPLVSSVLVLEEVLVCAVHLGQQQDSGCVVMAWHLPSCTRLPHPWHLAGPLEGSPELGTAPVLLSRVWGLSGSVAQWLAVVLSNATILAFGDSLTAAGYGSVPYGVYLAEMLGAKVEIAGVWAEATPAMLRLLRCGSAEVVLVLGGTNDVLGLGDTEDWKAGVVGCDLVQSQGDARAGRRPGRSGGGAGPAGLPKRGGLLCAAGNIECKACSDAGELQLQVLLREPEPSAGLAPLRWAALRLGGLLPLRPAAGGSAPRL
ncbi:unnamed protein product [Effrenium voratum]|nr:unnamed protein product [Effrenium voratum]